jgi:hypothetical protein
MMTLDELRMEVLDAFDALTASIALNDPAKRYAAIDRMFELSQRLIYIHAKAQRAAIPTEELH